MVMLLFPPAHLLVEHRERPPFDVEFFEGWRKTLPIPSWLDIPPPPSSNGADRKKRGVHALRRTHEAARSSLGPHHPETVQRLARLRLADGLPARPGEEREVLQALEAMASEARIRPSRDRIPALVALHDLHQALGIGGEYYLDEAMACLEAHDGSPSPRRAEILVHRLGRWQWNWRNFAPAELLPFKHTLALVEAIGAHPDPGFQKEALHLAMGSLCFMESHAGGHLESSSEGGDAQAKFLDQAGRLGRELPGNSEYGLDLAATARRLHYMESWSERGRVVGGVVGARPLRKPEGPPLWDQVNELVTQGRWLEARTRLDKAIQDLRSGLRTDWKEVDRPQAERLALLFEARACAWEAVQSRWNRWILEDREFRDRSFWRSVMGIPDDLEQEGLEDLANALRTALLNPAFGLNQNLLDDPALKVKTLRAALWTRALDRECSQFKRILEAIDEVGIEAPGLHIKLLEQEKRYLEAFHLQARGRMSEGLARTAVNLAHSAWASAEAEILFRVALDWWVFHPPKTQSWITDAKVGLGMSLSTLGRKEEALACFKEVIARSLKKNSRIEPSSQSDVPYGVSYPARSLDSAVVGALGILEDLGRFEEALRLAKRFARPLPQLQIPPPPPPSIDEEVLANWVPGGLSRLHTQRKIRARNALVSGGMELQQVLRGFSR